MILNKTEDQISTNEKIDQLNSELAKLSLANQGELKLERNALLMRKLTDDILDAKKITNDNALSAFEVLKQNIDEILQSGEIKRGR